jgi:ankyrin repeat protein
MMIAIVNDRYDLAATLVDLGADVNDGSLYHAVEMRDATTDWYARDGSKLRANHPNRRTALDLIALLLDKGADPNQPFIGQMHSATMCCDTVANGSPFFRAAIAADVEALKLLLARGADVEWTPSNAEGLKGANTNVGLTPLMVAMKGGRGVPFSAGPGFVRKGPPPFREPSNRDPADAVKLLLEAGANPNAVSPAKATVLHLAVETRNLETLKALTAAGASLSAKNADGLTPLQVAEKLKPDDPENRSPFGPQEYMPVATPEQIVALLREVAAVPAVAHEVTAR